MRSKLIILVLCFTLVGCGASEETIKLSEGIAAYSAQQEADINALLQDEDVRKKYPELSERIEKNAAAITRATKGLWLLLLGRSKDEVTE